MNSHTRVAVIGGGVTGCAVLYHLTKLGWSDVMLIERDELTSGATWHAAASNHVLQDITNIALLQHYTISYYPKLEAETGQSCGIHKVGGIYLAETPERHDQLEILRSKAKAHGFVLDRLTLEEAKSMNPLLDLDEVRAAYFQPDECHVDPSGVTQALARGAREAGAEIHRFNPVVATVQRPDGTWQVETEKGTVIADAVVNAAGLWGREVAALAGIHLPLMPMEHQYLVTESIPEIEALAAEIPLLHDNDRQYYMRQEGQGLLFGAYEKDGRHWSVDGTPQDFATELLPDDLERIAGNYEAACGRVPVLGEAGVKRVINGPMIWSPDVLPLIGPVPGVRNYYSATGVMAGFSQGIGLGRMLADWIVEGRPTWEIFAMDVSRFGDFATRDYTLARTAENYCSRYRIFFPLEEREAGRKARLRPNYERHAAAGAVFGANFGWEVPLYFDPDTAGKPAKYSFRRSGWFDAVGEECRAVRQGVGLMDVSHFAKYRVSGPDAAAWLDRLLANRVPRTVGKTTLSPMLNDAGRLIGDFTVTRLAEDTFMLLGSGAAELFHWRWIAPRLPADGVTFESLTVPWAGFSIAGPRSRDLLADVTGADVSNAAFPFLTTRMLDLAGTEAMVVRISFTGDLGYEIYFPEDRQLAVHDRLAEAGAAYGLRPFGSYALTSMRLEKGFGSWALEYGPQYSPYEAGLDRFVRTDKDDFVGRGGALRLAQQVPDYSLRMFAIETEDADAVGSEPVMLDGRIVGEVTSGGYAHWSRASLAFAYVETDALKNGGGEFTVDIVGQPRPARLLTEPLFDPAGERLRS